MLNPLTYPVVFRPFNNITPFTYRDGLTYVEVLEELQTWLSTVLVPHFNEEVSELNADYQAQVNQLIANINVLVEQLNSGIEDTEAAAAAAGASATAAASSATAAGDSAAAAAISAAAAAALIANIDTTITTLANNQASAFHAYLTNRNTWLNVKDFGAVGDGVTNDAPAIQAAWNYGISGTIGRTLYFPKGTYLYDAAPLTGSRLSFGFIGENASASIIKMGANRTYLVDESATSWNTIIIAGLTFDGGVTPADGFFRNTRTSANVSKHKIIRECIFANFKKSAISSDSADEPYWDIQFNSFSAGTLGGDTTTICVALKGSSDGSVINGNQFIRGRIMLKLGRPATVKITNNDFVHFGSGDGVMRAYIWLVASDSTGVLISGNKFGNEGIVSTDYHIIIADEDTGTGTYVNERMPQMAADSTAGPVGLLMDNNSFAGGSGAAPSPVYSTARDIHGLISNIYLRGSRPEYIVQFRTLASGNRTTQGNVIGPIQGNPTESAGLIGISNDPGWAVANDLGNSVVDTAIPYRYGGSDITGFTQLLSQNDLNNYTMVTTTKTQITDAMGGTEAVEVDGAGAMYAGITIPPELVGKPVWIEFDIQQGSSSPMSQIILATRVGSGTQHWQRVIRPPADAGRWERHQFMWIPRDTTATRMQFTFSVAGKVKLGRIRAYHARTPLNVDGFVLVRRNILDLDDINARSKPVLTANWSGAVNISADARGRTIIATLVGNVSSITLPTISAARSLEITLRIIQDATGSRTIAWPAAIKFAGGTDPTITATANATDLVKLIWDGANWWGQHVIANGS